MLVAEASLLDRLQHPFLAGCRIFFWTFLLKVSNIYHFLPFPGFSELLETVLSGNFPKELLTAEQTHCLKTPEITTGLSLVKRNKISDLVA